MAILYFQVFFSITSLYLHLRFGWFGQTPKIPESIALNYAGMILSFIR